MRKFKLIAATLAVLVGLSSVTSPASAHYYYHHHHKKVMKLGHGGGNAAVVWSIIGCAGGVVLAALAANYRDHRELTAEEAWSCGVLFLFSQPRFRNL
jgi:hypothetical protein